MAKLSADEFMKKVQTVLGDRDDDEALSFLEDCKDTITGEKDDWHAKYDALAKEKDELDKSWRAKYKERFYSTDTNINNDNNDNTDKDPNFDTRTEEQKKAETIRIDDLFKPAE